MTALIMLQVISTASPSLAYRPGDVVPMSRMGQYHSTRTVWHDMIGKHCPIFAVNRERYSGADLLGVTAKVTDMPHSWNSFSQLATRIYFSDLETHPDIHKQFWDQQLWPKHILVRYTWEEHSEIDVTSGFYVLFGSGLILSFMLSIFTLQSSRDKLTRFVRETVADSSLPGGVVKVE